jgi:hypothetical protein
MDTDLALLFVFCKLVYRFLNLTHLVPNLNVFKLGT